MRPFLCACAGWSNSDFLLTFKTKDFRPGWLELANAGNTHSPFHCRKGIIFKVFFCTFICSFLLQNTLQHIFIHDGFLTGYLKPCYLSLSKGDFFLDSLMASLLERPFTLLTGYISSTGSSDTVFHSISYCLILPPSTYLFSLLKNMQL